MPITLRIDVDNPYPQINRFKRGLNRLRNDLEDLFPPLPELGYLSDLSTLIDYLDTRGVRATVFFKRSTLPTPSLAERITNNGNDVALHAHRSNDLQSFRKDLDKVRKCFPQTEIRGFSKHGSGVLKLGLRHTPSYDEEELIQLAIESGLEYFSGNGEDPSSHSKRRRGILIFPSAFWLNPDRRPGRYDLNWLVEESKTRDVACLIHPKEFTRMKGVMELLDQLTSRSSFTTFDDLL